MIFSDKKNDEGFSLLEILVALTMFVIILTSTGWAIVTAINSQNQAEARDKAIQISQDAMSIASKIDYDELGFTPAQIDDAVLAQYYANPNTYTLPKELDDPSAGTTQNRSVIATASSSALRPYVQGIYNVDDWTDTTTTGREYTLITNITDEAAAIDRGGNTIPTGKRVTVEVRWAVQPGQGNCGPNNTFRCVYQTYLRSPSADEQIPAGVGSNTGVADGCDQPAPFCRVYVTPGNVIAKNPGPTGEYPLAVPVQFFVETREPVAVTEVTASINYPEVDRGKVCGERDGGIAIEYGFCGNLQKIPSKLVVIGPQTVDNPEGFRLLSGNADNQGTLFLATLPTEVAAIGTDAQENLKGYVRPGTWPVQFSVDSNTVTYPVSWSYSDDTPLSASVVGSPVIPNGPVRFRVDGLSPNTLPYGESLRLVGFQNPGPNASGADHIEATAQFYNPDGTSYEKPLYLYKDGISTWDSSGTTMGQQFTIPAAQLGNDIINPFLFGPQNFNIKVRTTRAVDGITTTSVLSIPITSSSIPTPPVPSAPLNLTVNNRTDLASWNVPAYTGGLPITYYKVTAYDAPTGGNAVGYCTSPTLSCTIPNITDGNTYYAEIFGANKYVSGDTSTPRVAFTSDKSTPPSAPTNLNVNGFSVATWDASASNGGRPITGYTVRAWTAATGGTVAGTCSTTGALTCTIPGLTNLTTYYAEVVATNSTGDSDPSSPRTAFMPDTATVPDRPTGVVVNLQGLASWVAPASNGGATITGYTARAYTATTGGTPVSTCTTAGALSCSFTTGLTDGETYYVDVIATNSKGNSVPSTPRVSFIMNPNATGGSNIYTITVGSDLYRVHEFRTVGAATFRPNAAFDVEYLVVAGGGAGGYPNDRTGGGGGAGGMLTGNLMTTKNGNYAVTVGAGGVAGTNPTNGGNSVFGAVTTTGGGRGGGQSRAANTGGSGGGGYHNSPQGYTTRAGVAGQGNNGGSGWDSGNVNYGFYAGGGGGAGGPGQSTTIGAEARGNGGVGRASNITGTNVFYAGGGGGGNQVFNTVSPGGNGGGGNGGNNDYTAPVAGAANTGGGGGGGSSRISGGLFQGANGGSGVVIVRYKIR